MGDASMKSTFFNLDPEKRERFLAACAEEFAEHGYELASTNRIVEGLGIAKGSFFKYAESKEDVFLYLVQLTLEELGRIQASPSTYSSPDILVRAKELFGRHLDYAGREPARYRLVLRAYLETRSPVYPRLAELRARIGASSGTAIYDGVDWDIYRFPREEIVEVLGLLDLGLRQSALASLRATADVAGLERYTVRILELAHRMLREGIYREDSGRDKE
jgi:AcrR family transcriptional regulator